MRAIRAALAVLIAAMALGALGCARTEAAQGPPLLRAATGDSGRALAPHRELITRFSAREPAVDVRLEAVSGGDYYTRLLTQYASGGAPDIVQLGDDAVAAFVSRGALLPLDARMAQDPPLRDSDYVTGVTAPGRWRGQLYLLPKDFTPVGVFCNAAVFRRRGVPLPREGWTWDDFRRTARALTHDDDGDGQTDTWGVVMPGPVASTLELFAAGAGGGVVNDDGSYSGALDGPAALEAVAFVRGVVIEDRSAPLPQELGVWEGGNRQFEQGKAGMWVTGRWPQPGLVETFGKDLVVVPPPLGPKAPSNILFWAGFAISAQSRHPDLAWRFLRNHAGPDASTVWRAWALPSSSALVKAEKLESDPLDGPWLRSLATCRPRAYTRDRYWARYGEPAARALMETAILTPERDYVGTAHALAAQADAWRRRAVAEEGP
ncbi:MAG: sugar ABC transporter substrate-binding protein [Proteobacteria bacterium]|nr:sugar ABC transporter substrate-binding protein [Pseudomonadota bacterium]